MNDLSEAPEISPNLSKPSPQIDAVLFDYGQVLSRGPNSVAWDRMCSALGANPELFAKAYWESRHEYDRGDLSGKAYWIAVAKAVGHSGLGEAELEDLYRADLDLWSDLNEPMVAWANELQQRGIRTGILSNIGDQMEMGIRKRFGWIVGFHHCTWSHRLNMAKPEIEIYRHAAEALATLPERILFIDDREENIDGARKAGMLALHYTNHEAFTESIRTLGLSSLL